MPTGETNQPLTREAVERVREALLNTPGAVIEPNLAVIVSWPRGRILRSRLRHRIRVKRGGQP